ncbi:peptide/nickel transport system permease protein [Ilumatobacter fluminis]|uniref:Peptide/nickel transport system permease protein n=1 Tax=Ilumatobacter fluminis TaxID=467091 RepID=A0A4R7HVF5_9ACTN|nr:peptide/nickel transport system permease protein [Ilumatobacter fluminis]
MTEPAAGSGLASGPARPLRVPPVVRQIGHRLLVLVGVLFAVSVLTFMLTSLLPGDPALQVLGTEDATPEALERVRDELGLDEPLPLRYLDWLSGVVRGDFGSSYITNQPVAGEIANRAPVTLEIGALALAISLLSIPLAVGSAHWVGRAFDQVTSTVSFGMLSVPTFVLALVLIYTLAVETSLLPATGWTRLTPFPENLADNLRGAILPALTLAIGNIAVLTRVLRTDMLATLQQDYLVMARSMGVSTRRLLFVNALRPSSFTLLTVLGVQIGAMIGGAVIVETLFAVPGMGRLLVDAIFQRDLMVVQGVVLVMAASFVIVNFLADLAYLVVDPRLRSLNP